MLLRVPGAVAHPLVVPLPRLVPPVGRLVRAALLARLRATWAGGRLDLVLPGGERERIGPPGPADATARVHDERMFLRLLLRGELGGGEAFVAGEWSSDDLVGVLRVFLRGTAARGAESPLTRAAQLGALVRHRRARNTHAGSARNIHAHYDLGNAFYALFLDPVTLAYSCGIVADRATDTPVAAGRATDTLAAADRATDTLATADRATDTPVAADRATDPLAAADRATDTPAAADRATDTLAAADRATDATATLAAADRATDTLAAADRATGATDTLAAADRATARLAAADRATDRFSAAGRATDTPAARGCAETARQEAKLERLCSLLALSPRDHLLEIGCGWGGMAIHAARTRGCRVTAITISRAQYELAAARVAAAGLADRVTIALRDYRDQRGTFDKLVSIEMLEAVGHDFLPGFFATCARLLRPGGALALQSITMPDDRFAAYRQRVDWMQTYVFPGSCIPSVAVIRALSARAGFTLADALDIGASYPATLRTWRERFLATLPEVRALGFDDPFIRTWLMYLAFSEAAFAERTLGDHQLLLRR